MNYDDFAEATGALRVLEKKILNQSDLERAIDAKNADDALKMLSQNSEYDFSVIERPEAYEIVLKNELKRIYDLLYKLSVEPIILDIPALKYDYHNIKVILKGNVLNKNFDDLFIEVSRVSPIVLKEAILKNEWEEIPPIMAEGMQEALKIYEETKDTQQIDLVLDKTMFRHMLTLAKKADIAFIVEYVEKAIDFYNIKTLLRVKNMKKGMTFLNEALVEGSLTDTKLFIQQYDKSFDVMASTFYYQYFGDTVKKAIDEHEKTGNFSALEKSLDNVLIKLANRSKLIAFGPEVLFAYALSKENEIRQVRILATCKVNKIDSEITRERLRDNYA